MTRRNVKNMIGILLFAILLLGTSDRLFSQTVSDLEEFLIRLEKTDKGIRLTGREGCAFKGLDFTLRDSVRRSVDQYGKVTLVRFSTKGIPKEGLADFQISLMQTEEGLYLEGIRGTAWEELSLTYPEDANYHFIDQNGIVELPQPFAMMD